MIPEFKSISLDLKAVDGESEYGEFEAVLSTPDMDRDGEKVVTGAFQPLPKSIPVHFSHDFVDKVPPVGRAVPFYEGDTLKCRGTFASTPRAQELRSLVNEGVIDSMSAGFLTTKTRGKSIIQADLIEGSLTATPVNRNALLLRSKAVTADEVELAFGLKAGARNSSTDGGRLQQIHDLSVENGADCMAAKSVKTVTTTDSDESVGALAQAVDAALDELASVLPDNPEQAKALLTAAEATVDTLLEALGVSDADDPEATPETAAATPAPAGAAAAKSLDDAEDLEALRSTYELLARSA